MPAARALDRLLRIRHLQEEQRRTALEAAMGEMRRLVEALAAAGRRDAWGRRLIASSVRAGGVEDRFAGLEESRAAHRHTASLLPRIADAKDGIEALREQFLASRVERRQVETLIEEASALRAIEEGRRSQQAIDDAYGFRRRSLPSRQPGHKSGRQSGRQ